MAAPAALAAATVMNNDVSTEAVELIERLRPGSPRLRNAVSRLVQIGAPAVEPLVAALDHARWQVRQQAAKALGRIGDPRAVEPLVRALGDRRREVRRAAVRALGQIQDARAVEPLIAVLDDRTVLVRDEAVAALARMGNARAVWPLIAALQDRTVGRTRPELARALGEIALRDPVPDLRAALPILQRLARAFWGGRSRRKAYETAIQRIEEATAAWKDLPVAAAAPPASADTLPLPAQPPAPTPDGLPIPASGDRAETKPLGNGWWQRLRRRFEAR